MSKLLSFSNTAWYLHNYRVPVDRVLRSRGWEVVMASPDGDFRDDVEQKGFRWHEVAMTRSGVNPLEEWRTIERLASILREERPDIIHTFTMKGNVNGAFAARRAGFHNVVTSIAGLGFVFSSPSLFARILRGPATIAYRAALARGETIFQNAEDRDAFVRQGIVRRDRATLIRSSGVDVEHFVPAELNDNGPIRILYAARLLWTKGVGELVEAVRRLKAQGVNFELLVAGKPDPGNPATVGESDLEQWTREGLMTRLGFHADMASLLQTCHIACFPSKHKEGTPRFLVEAAAAGLPIVTTRNRGCVEVVEDKVNGLLVPVGDAGALADAMLRLIRDPDLRREYGRRGREIALRDFSIGHVADETERVYRKLVGDGFCAGSDASNKSVPVTSSG